MRFVTVRLKTVLMAVLIGSALLLGSGFAYATEAAQVWQSGARSLPVYSVERTDNKIASSFDCAWGTEHTDAILSALAEAGVRATFFTVQFWAEEHADYLKRCQTQGTKWGRTVRLTPLCPDSRRRRSAPGSRAGRRRSRR